MNTKLSIIYFILLSALAACGPETATPNPPPPRPTELQTSIALATETATPSVTPSPVPTVDGTAVAEGTLESIRLAAVATGWPEGSVEFEVQVQATQCAVLPPPTPTALPIAIVAANPATVSTTCLGGDLPFEHKAWWVNGRWVEAKHWQLANAAEVQAAQQAYLNYLTYLWSEPLTTTTQLEQFLVHGEELAASRSCQFPSVLRALSGFVQQGQWVQVSPLEAWQWSEDYQLRLSANQIEVAMPWKAQGLTQRLVDLTTGKVLQQAALPLLAGTAILRYDVDTQSWRLVDDANGYFCTTVDFFVQ